MYLHSIVETEELKQKRINGIHQDLFKLTAEMEFRGNGNRIIGGESVLHFFQYVIYSSHYNLYIDVS